MCSPYHLRRFQPGGDHQFLPGSAGYAIGYGGVNLMPKQNNEKTTQGAGPLDGLLIADFSRVLAGPYCTMLLGDLGATVIKVESPAGDDTRTWIPPDRNGVATYYMAINRNKRSIVLDFTDSSDLRLAQEFAARAGIFI